MKKTVNLVALLVMVSTNIITPFSYADVENGAIVDIEQPVVEQPKAPETPEPETPATPEIKEPEAPEVSEPEAQVEQSKAEPETGTGVDEKVETPAIETPKTGTGVEEKVETPAIETPETGTGADEKVETPAIETPETGTGMDEKVETPAIETPETGTGVEEKVETPIDDQLITDLSGGNNLSGNDITDLMSGLDLNKEGIELQEFIPTASKYQTIYITGIDGTLIQANNQQWEDLELYFVSSTGKVSHFTIMDRNLGAKEVYNQKYSETEMNTGSIGYHYQWGNNYGFEPCYEGNGCSGFLNGEIAIDTAIPYEVWSTHIPYASNIFVYNNGKFSEGTYVWNWMSGATVDNMYIWSDENFEQGPCPDGYYIPSGGDWSKIYNLWGNSINISSYYGNNTEPSEMVTHDLLLPLAGGRGPYNSVGFGSNGSYISTSIDGLNIGDYYFFNIVKYGIQPNVGTDNIKASSLRCFKKTTNENIFDLDAYGATGFVIAIDGEKITSLGTPKKANFIFSGWYSDEQYTTEIKEGDNIPQTLHAKFLCPEGKQPSPNNLLCVDGYEYSALLTGDNEEMNGFGWNEIAVGDYIIMDRNLGAKTSWDGTNWNFNSEIGYYGYYYQWGNNRGFTSSATIGGTGEIVVPDDKIPSGYTSNQWIKKVMRSRQSDLWGDITNTQEARQGPCPEGWHVPSRQDWDNIINAWKASDSKSTGYSQEFKNFAKDLLIPLIGHVDENFGFVDRGSNVHVWSSSERTYYRLKGDNIEKQVDHLEGGYDGSIETMNISRGKGLPVRCMKNIPTWKITYHLSGGIMSTTKGEVKKGEKLTTKLVPAKENSRFLGWYTDEGLTNRFNYSNVIDSDIDLYAKWGCQIGTTESDDGSCVRNGNEYTITLSGDDESMNTFTYKTIEIGDDIIMDRNLGAKEVRDGRWMQNGEKYDSYGYYYQFGNNYGFSAKIEPTERTSVMTEEELNNSIPSKYYSEYWTPDNYTPYKIYTSGLDLWGVKIGTDSARKGPCPEGWHVGSQTDWDRIYSAWNQNSDRSTEWDYSSKNFAQDLLLPPAGYFSVHSWSSSLDELGKVGEYLVTSPHSQGQPLQRVFGNYSYNYAGWSNYNAFSVRCVKNSPTYTVTYHPNGGVMSQDEVQEMARYSYVYPPTPTTGNDNYIFGGWYNNENFLGSRISYVYLTGDIDLYAKWNHAYTLTYHPGIGSLSNTVQKIEEGTNQYLSDPYTGNKQYTFEGWYLNENFTGNRVYSVNMRGDVDVYAKWIYHEYYNIKFHVRNEIFEKNALEGRALTNLAPTTFPDGYIVGGWYLDAGYTQKYDITKPITGNMDLYATGFQYGTIVVEDPDNAANSGFIIMDRNLGAFEAGTGVNSYGYHYQWGNNYGFPNTGEIPTNYSTLTWNSGYDNRGYYQSGYNSYISRNDGKYHTGVWGGAGDNYDNNRGLDNIAQTVTGRQGPCPEGWHVPSAGEWSKLMEYWKKGYMGNASISVSTDNKLNYYSFSPSAGGQQFFDDLKLPVAGYRSSYSSSTEYYRYYRSSTPVYNNYAYILNSYNEGYVSSYSNNGYSYGYSVRCFKNEYNPVTHTVNFETNGGESMPDMSVVEGKPLNLKKDPINVGSFFKGWYKDRELTQPYDMTAPVNENITLYAKWDNSFGTISISDPNNINSGFTIMDRNLGALEVGTGRNSYGYMYQWGNNYGFLNNSGKVETTTVLPEWNSGYDNKGYYGTQFVVAYNGQYDYWRDGQLHNGIWGGALDNSGNNRGLDNIAQTVTGRQGPCPEGYHVPSAGEWSKLMEYWANTYAMENGVNIPLSTYDKLNYFSTGKDSFQKYFMLPLAGVYRVNQPNINPNAGNPGGYYRSSSPNFGSNSARYMYFDLIRGYTATSTNTSSRYYGHSIRCFANKYEVNKYVLSFESNGGDEIDNREIGENHKLMGLPVIERENSKFEGWYLDDKFTQEYDFNGLINKDLKFYAKWSCNTGYELSDDLQSCKPFSVNFIANGGNFSDGNNTYLVPVVKNIIVEETIKTAHSPNLSDEGEYVVKSSSDTVPAGFNISSMGRSTGNVEIFTGSSGYIQISGANKLNVSVRYGGGPYGHSTEEIGIWTGEHTDYIPNDQRSSAVRYISTFPSYGSFKTDEFTVDGDSISIVQYKGHPNYGWYIVVKSLEEYNFIYPDDAFDNIPEPTRKGYIFSGWYLDDGTFEHEFNLSEVTTGASINVYAKRIVNEESDEPVDPVDPVEPDDPVVPDDGKDSSSSSSSGGGGKRITPASSDSISDKIKEKEHNSADEKQDEDKSEDVQENQDSSTPSMDGDSQVEVKTSEGQNAGENKSSQEASQYTNEQVKAYSFAKSNGITTTSTIEKAKMNTSLKRIEMAKMLSNYAINILGQEPDASKGTVKFNDVTINLDRKYDDGVTKAYQLGIMGINMKNNEFRPDDEVTRAEFVTALSRLLYSTPEGTNKGTKKYYEPHMAKLYNEGIITKTDPNMKEKRGNVMIMLMRAVK